MIRTTKIPKGYRVVVGFAVRLPCAPHTPSLPCAARGTTQSQGCKTARAKEAIPCNDTPYDEEVKVSPRRVCGLSMFPISFVCDANHDILAVHYDDLTISSD